jgi:hypothetical protein
LGSKITLLGEERMTKRIFYHTDSTALQIKTKIEACDANWGGSSTIVCTAYKVYPHAVLPESFFDSEHANNLGIDNPNTLLNLIATYKIKDGELSKNEISYGHPHKSYGEVNHRFNFEVVGADGYVVKSASNYSAGSELIYHVNWEGFPATEKELLEKVQEEIDRLEDLRLLEARRLNWESKKAQKAAVRLEYKNKNGKELVNTLNKLVTRAATKAEAGAFQDDHAEKKSDRR